MESFTKIIEILAWPVTAIFIVLLLRTPLSELVPTLKKLKYKDLELEFEREANKIRSEAERDLPEIPEKPKTKANRSTALFSVSMPEPATQILDSWRSLEISMREIAKKNNVQAGLSIYSLISALESNGFISKEIVRIALDLAALRNKVAHTDKGIITRDVSSAFISSVKRVKSAMEEGKS